MLVPYICLLTPTGLLPGGAQVSVAYIQGGFDAKCDRAGVLQALWAVPSTLEGKTRRKHSNSQTEWQKWCAGRATRSTNDFKIMLKLSLSKSLRHLLVGVRAYTIAFCWKSWPQKIESSNPGPPDSGGPEWYFQFTPPPNRQFSNPGWICRAMWLSGPHSR